MINVLSYVGINMQSEVCLWTLLGLVRTIFDATLFKVNANLKQVWQMAMPVELSMPMQRALRTMISSVMLVQCFTVYVYLASYIVLLYPVFLEERPTLVLPWLLLAAIRHFLCELTSLALGLGTCVLLGPARPPCIKFVIMKVISIMPAFYMWMLLFRYYHALKVASTFKTFTTVLPPSDNDCGLELAIRRRRTKSLFGEEQLRSKLVASFYGETNSSIEKKSSSRTKIEMPSRMIHSTDTSIEDIRADMDILRPLSVISNKLSDSGSYEDWFGSEVIVPRDTDRIIEQFVLMLLRIGAYIKREGIHINSHILNSSSPFALQKHDTLECPAKPADETDTPPLVGSSKGNTASYLREYPQIFMKMPSDLPLSAKKTESIKTESQIERDTRGNVRKSRKRAVAVRSNERISLEIERYVSRKKLISPDKKNMQKEISDRSISPRKMEIEQTLKPKGDNRKEIDMKGEPVMTQRNTTATDQLLSTSTDSLKSIINKVQRRLSENNKSEKVDKTKKEANFSTSNRSTDQLNNEYSFQAGTSSDKYKQKSKQKKINKE